MEPEGGAATVQIWETNDPVDRPNTFNVKGKWDSTRGGMEPFVTTVLTSRKRYRLPPGNYWVLAHKNNRQVFRKLTSVGWGGQTTLRIPAKAPEPEPDWIPLFNGTDLAGWDRAFATQGGWTVEDRVLVGRGRIFPLYGEHDNYGNFHLRYEAKINKNGKGSVCARAKIFPGFGFAYGYDAKINSETGVLDAYGTEQTQDRSAGIPSETWFSGEIVVIGNHVVVRVNGSTTADFLDPNHDLQKGYVALQCFHPDTVIQFRKVELEELPAN